jgi:hypothetical protein
MGATRTLGNMHSYVFPQQLMVTKPTVEVPRARLDLSLHIL